MKCVGTAVAALQAWLHYPGVLHCGGTGEAAGCSHFCCHHWQAVKYHEPTHCASDLWILWPEQKNVQCIVPLITNFYEAAWGSRLDRAQEWEILHYGGFFHLFLYFSPLCWSNTFPQTQNIQLLFGLGRPFKVETLKLVCKYHILIVALIDNQNV